MCSFERHTRFIRCADFAHTVIRNAVLDTLLSDLWFLVVGLPDNMRFLKISSRFIRFVVFGDPVIRSAVFLPFSKQLLRKNSTYRHKESNSLSRYVDSLCRYTYRNKIPEGCYSIEVKLRPTSFSRSNRPVQYRSW